MEDFLFELLVSRRRRGPREIRPQLVMYVAGADPYRVDQLGLALTIEGLKRPKG